MALVKIVYASMTGNTEGISEIIEDQFIDAGLEVEREECTDVDPDFFEDADICIVATYTYGDGELPFEIEDFFADLEEEDLEDKLFGVVGSGDTEYGEYFCQSARDFVEQFKKTGATEGAEMVEIENEADGEDTERLQAFVDQLVSKVE
ncbi:MULTISPECIES: flavodoxin [Enterococcaceae]|uniref:flavodoxin n=1 Tax=Enterococcaceae TaxID=81852 RepID=UPI000E4A52B1|nr:MULTISPECIES: flavodoxin [Enterococcaceae]MCI0130282.1 flavodoxin [Vagococcus sp. CY53-2]RGI28462.1 flavodoxin [Melissococcus sp. OM08-11BH]UNM89105.1 flavodoxin [Vagococcus sp. CY52-2]